MVIHSLYTSDLFRFRFDVSFLFLALDRSPQRNRSIIGDNLDILRVSGKRVVRCKGLPYVLSDRPVGLVLGLIPGRLGLIVTVSNIAAGVVRLYGLRNSFVLRPIL